MDWGPVAILGGGRLADEPETTHNLMGGQVWNHQAYSDNVRLLLGQLVGAGAR